MDSDGLNALLQKTGSLVHPDEIAWCVSKLEKGFPDYTYIDSDDERLAWLRSQIRSVDTYLQRVETTRVRQRYVRTTSKQPRIDASKDFNTKRTSLRGDLEQRNFFSAWSALACLWTDTINIVRVICEHEFLAAIGIFTGGLTDTFVREHWRDEEETESSDESEEETKLRPGRFMPRAVKSYYHTVVHFSGDSNVGSISNKRRALSELRDDIIKYCNSNRAVKGHSTIVVDHFCTSDRALVQLLNDGAFRQFSSSDETGSCEPHIHIVHYVASRKPAGIWRIVDQWIDKVNGGIQSSTQVKNFHLLRQYLRQGRGRLVRFEEISGGVDGGDANAGASDTAPDLGATNFQCEDDGEPDTWCRLVGK